MKILIFVKIFMCEYLLCFYLSLLTLPHTLQAQEHPRTLIKINLMSPILNSVATGFEQVISPASSVQLSGFYTWVKVKNTEYNGFGVIPAFRVYLDSETSPAGFFVNTFIKYQNLNLHQIEINQEADLTTLGGGFDLGGQWIFAFKTTFSIEVYAGITYDFPRLSSPNGTQEDDFDIEMFTRINPRFGVTAGLAF